MYRSEVLFTVNSPEDESTPKKIYRQYSLGNSFFESRGRRVVKLGDKDSGIPSRVTVQDFHQLQAECLSKGKLFEDPEFPATDTSIYYSKKLDFKCTWKRPTEITRNPKFFVEGPSRFDIKQGSVGDCWFLAAAANLTLNKSLFYHVIPKDQSYDQDYAGIFHFRFWQYGRWVDVVVDDRLPTKEDGKLAFVTSSETNEFWSALFEKAYAKLHGSYESLDGGTVSEAMVDFSGGVSEIFTHLGDFDPNGLLNVMLKAYERGSMMGCAIFASPDDREAITQDGLVKGHAYSITKVKEFEFRTRRKEGKIGLIRIRNPWGQIEWTGPWSDKSPEWRYIPEEEKKDVGLTFEHDGEFWISAKYFWGSFSEVEMCHLSPDCLSEETLQEAGTKRWQTNIFEASWVKNVTAGGCRKYGTFWRNPQYRIKLEQTDEDDDSMCTVLVDLIQKNRREQRKMGRDNLCIGFEMFPLPADLSKVPTPLNKTYFLEHPPVKGNPPFTYSREVSQRYKVPPGVYCIVPSTYEPNNEGEFIIRVFSETRNEMQVHDEEIGFSDIDPRVQPPTELNEAQTQYFKSIAGDDMQIDWKELKQILDIITKAESPTHTGYSKEVCRSLLALMDVDHSGKLSFQEFNVLWTDLGKWQGVFKLYDKENAGILNLQELREALNSAGYKVNCKILNLLGKRYGDNNGNITFKEFLLCAIRLKAMIHSFVLSKSTTGDNQVTFTLEQWLEKTLYT